TATTTDGGNAATAASTSGTIDEIGTASCRARHLDLNSGSAGDQHTGTAAGNEDTAIALDIATSLSEADPDAVISVTTAGVAKGASLNHGSIIATDANGVTTWSVNPADLASLTLTSDGETQSFTLTVTATTTDGGNAATAASTSGTIDVSVTPVANAPHLDLNSGSAGDQHTGTPTTHHTTTLPPTTP